MKKSVWVKLVFFLTLSIKIFSILLNNKNVYPNEIDSFNTHFKNINYDKESSIDWKKIQTKSKNKKPLLWKKSDLLRKKFFKDNSTNNNQNKILNTYEISSLNRSIVFNNDVIGPDISWLVPNGFKWSPRYKIDTSIRGYNQDLSNRRTPKQQFLEWGNGDAVGQFYYQFLDNKKASYGVNIGLRSVTKSSNNKSPIGDGTSIGFRRDYKLTNTSGFAFGAEQLIHFNGVTDTGRDLYLTISKAFWKDNKEGQFPLRIATAALATGRLAEGNIRGLCSDLLDGAGTEEHFHRRLCWAPVFSLANVFNQNISTFFEYNSRFFLIGTSVAPFERSGLRGTFAVTIADHIDNYKLYDFNDMTWTFRLSLGF